MWWLPISPPHDCVVGSFGDEVQLARQLMNGARAFNGCNSFRHCWYLPRTFTTQRVWVARSKWKRMMFFSTTSRWSGDTIARWLMCASHRLLCAANATRCCDNESTSRRRSTWRKRVGCSSCSSIGTTDRVCLPGDVGGDDRGGHRSLERASDQRVDHRARCDIKRQCRVYHRRQKSDYQVRKYENMNIQVVSSDMYVLCCCLNLFFRRD